MKEELKYDNQSDILNFHQEDESSTSEENICEDMIKFEIETDECSIEESVKQEIKDEPEEYASNDPLLTLS